jgi:hypothetical protein
MVRAGRGSNVVAAATAGLVALAPAIALAQAKQGEEQPTVEPSGEAKHILDQSEGYRFWPKFSEYEKGAKKSKGHGGMFVVGYYNDVAAKAAQSDGSFPDGSILVKENRLKPDAAPDALTIMAKRNGSWYWIKSTPIGKVFIAKGKPLAGKVQSCIGCHSSAPRDMVFSK